MPTADTIAAIATPLGSGGVGIIRISGDDVSPFAAVWQSGVLPAPRVATRAQFVDATGQPIDDGLVLYFPKPHSFTGEAVLELQAHGSYFALQSLLSRCLQLGARQATAGEFTLRAYLNNKLDLTQSEALADLINANTAAAARAAAQSLRGAFKAAVDSLIAKVAAVRAELEGSFDFSDDDALLPQSEAVMADIDGVSNAIHATLAQARSGAQLTRGVSVVIAGVPNVGKSSLMNYLAEDDVAIVTPQVGTTRDIVERRMNIDGVSLCVADTAGVRETSDVVERQGVMRTQQKLDEAAVILSVRTADTVTIARPKDNPTAAIIEVVNKIDLSGVTAGVYDGVCYVSAKSGAGIAALRAALLRASCVNESEAPFSARTRHVVALEMTLDYLSKAKENAAMPEVAAAWLRDAQAALGAISGDGDDSESLLGEIFARFCVGK